MDPNERLRMIDEFLTGKHTGNIVDRWCEDLHQWIKTSGTVKAAHAVRVLTSVVRN